LFKTFFSILSFSPLFFAAFAYTIEEKRAQLIEKGSLTKESSAEERNKLVKEAYEKLEDEYSLAATAMMEDGNQEAFENYVKNIASLREELSDLENGWKEEQSSEFKEGSETSGIWDLGEISISKLILEYGSCDFLYSIPPEIASLKISLHSLLTIPKESWPKMIELILTHNNIGIKKLNPFAKQLYLLKEDYTNVEVITSLTSHLDAIDENTRIIFVYTPPIENIKTSFYFLDKFKNPKNTYVYQVGSKIAIVGLKRDISKLITLAENVWDKGEERVSKILSPQKISADDAVKLLSSYFGGLTDYSRPMASMKGGNGISAFPLKGENSLIIIGSLEIVEQAEALLRKTECQVDDPSEVTMYWHNCSHASPESLAELLSKVYLALQSTEIANSSLPSTTQMTQPPKNPTPLPASPSPQQGYTPQNQTNILQKQGGKGSVHSDHFFPFPASHSLLIVVRKDTLPKIKEILKKLDTPKKMVEIEVLLCERRVGNNSSSGINLLKMGDSASNRSESGFGFDGSKSGGGIMEFLLKTTAHYSTALFGGGGKSIPPIDLSYTFLLSQENIMVTASPSTTTLNQMPTTLSITDQISINNGATIKEKESIQSYSREDFGITLTLTPTIHEPEGDDGDGQQYITLENNIQFDTIQSNSNDRPSVHKRHITNTVRIPDGQTVIIGGLRSSKTEELSHKIPFLGEIPGFAKIFGSSKTSNINNEMFIFIKPKVIKDPSTDLLRIREERLKKRHGDCEEILMKMNESRKNGQKISMKKSLDLIYGNGISYEQTL